MADMYTLTFHWPDTNANSVIVTGTFDNWTCSVHLHKSDSGFTGSVSVPWDTKILYKFIVDNNWVTHSSHPTETDASGFVNNVVHTPPVPAPVAIPEETTKETEEQPEEKTEAPVEVAPAVAVPIQPVLDPNTDSSLSPGVNPVDPKADPSTHSTAPVEAVTEPTPVHDKSSEPAPAPSTPPRKESELPVQESPAAPVTPIKTNGTNLGHAHARTSTGTSTPPSSSAPSTPKTQRTFPTAEFGGGGESGSPTSSRYGSLGRARAKRQSFFGKIREKFRGSPGKEKKKRLGSEEPRTPSPSPSPRK